MRASGDTYEQLAEYFLEEQQGILGEQASQIADGVSGIHVDGDGTVEIEGDGKDAIDRLSEEFRSMFGTNIEESMLTAADKLDHAVELPSSLGLERELRGYTEYRDDDDWHAVDAVQDVEPQPDVWTRLFGFGTPEESPSEFDGQPIAERRGVPLDASETVYEAWIEQKEAESGSLMATGHTWVTAGEIPETLLSKAASDLVSSLLTTKDRYGPDRARLVVWLRYGNEL